MDCLVEKREIGMVFSELKAKPDRLAKLQFKWAFLPNDTSFVTGWATCVNAR